MGRTRLASVTRARTFAQARAVYPKLLMKLYDARSISERFAAGLIRTDASAVQPLMAEVLKLPDSQTTVATQTSPHQQKKWGVGDP